MERDELFQNWPIKSLAEVATISAGTTAPQEAKYFENGTLPFVRAQDVGRCGQTASLTETVDKVNQLAVTQKRLRLARRGAVLFPKSGASILTNSRAKLGVDAYVVSHLAIVEANNSILSDDFLFHWLCSLNMAGAAQSEAGYPSLRLSDVADFQIPVPTLPEQRRIVARLDAMTSRSLKLRELNSSLVEDMTRLLRAEYKRITEDAPTKPFSDVAKLVRRWVKTKPDQNYPETGIRSFGKGTFHKPALTGEQLGTKRICRIKAGDLVFMNVFAWEGAIAVAQPEDDGRVASHRFMMHEVLPDQATAEFMCYYFLTERGLEQIRGASPGSAGRNRTLGITKLEKIPVPVPRIEDQRRFAKLWKLHFQLQRLHREADAELALFMPALLSKAFRGRL